MAAGCVCACTLEDGVVVDHTITAGDDEIDFRLTGRTIPPTKTPSRSRRQPCVRVDELTGRGKLDYIPYCFIFVDEKLTRLPTEPWATEAIYVPGQVYCPPHVDPNDVNPRPLEQRGPQQRADGRHFSDDGQTILATAWEPYHELFQGVGTCIHSDFRLGGLAAGETEALQGEIYIVPADGNALLRYHRDFPEHAQ